MPQTFSIGPTTSRQDAILAAIAAKRGVTVQAFVDGELARVFARAKNEFDIDEAARVGSAYTNAALGLQATVKTALGLP